jgi:hypothetical protein
MDLHADSLNADCTCISLDRTALCRALDTEVGDAEFCRQLVATHPTLISHLPVFLRGEHVARMAEIIRAIEAIAKLDGYQNAALQTAPAIARFRPGPIGVLMGYDFHLGPDGPRLIEINTNAGGGLINAFVARAQKACCSPVELMWSELSAGQHIDTTFVDSFRTDWRLQRGDEPLTRIAIVDANPEAQYLYPEFVLFQRLFRRHDIDAVIVPPQALQHRDGKLWLGTRPIDLVYNRLTDFYFEGVEQAALCSAYLAGDVVVTPNPRVHAMFADKRNLGRLTDVDTLRTWGVAQDLVDIVLQGIPKTTLVTPDRSDELWGARAKLFFKPTSGFGSKAAYRGDKVTRRVWQTILDNSYVAQELVQPSARTVVVDGLRQVMKVDVRNYTYDGKVQLLAARLYQGQTTNFRTPGGGFAPVLSDRGGTERLACAPLALVPLCR